MPAPVSIGQRFTQLIQHLGLSKNAFAQSLDKTATVIQHLVDERNKPGYDLLCKVFETYPNVSKDWLLLGQGPMLVMEVAAPAPHATAPVPATATDTIATLVAAPASEAPAAAVPPAIAAPVAPVQQPSVGSLPPAPSLTSVAALPPVVPAVVPAPASAPDPAYFTAALQTQYLQHQLALAEQRNQHLLAQQQLMQQMVDLLQRAV
ncbi:MAG: helix-turn-helix domain-containing protein [Janthinobacterium lividum]